MSDSPQYHYSLLCDLEPEERFLLPLTQKRGTLLHLSESSATVKYDGGEQKRTVTDKRTGEEKEFIAASKHVSISPRTIVVKLVKKKKTK